MYVSMCISASLCMFLCLSVCDVCVYVSVCVLVCVSLGMHVYVYVSVCMSLYLCVWACVCLSLCMHVFCVPEWMYKHQCMLVPTEAREIRDPVIGITGSCRPLDVGAGNRIPVSKKCNHF